MNPMQDVTDQHTVNWKLVSSNRPVRDFYARLGFAYVMRMRSYYGNGDDALVLLARLPLRIR